MVLATKGASIASPVYVQYPSARAQTCHVNVLGTRLKRPCSCGFSRRGQGDCFSCDPYWYRKQETRFHKYGTTPYSAFYLLKSQGFGCANLDCRKKLMLNNLQQGQGLNNDHVLQVDHDHSRGSKKRSSIRGGLCLSCNVLLGKRKDLCSSLRRAGHTGLVSYLESCSDRMSALWQEHDSLSTVEKKALQLEYKAECIRQFRLANPNRALMGAHH